MNNPPSLRILIVDDEPLIRWCLAETFARSGHVVTEAGDAETALGAIQQKERFDAVLLDYRLPDSNDLGLLTSVRLLTPSSAVILMTAFGTPELSEYASTLGVFRVVPKPFDLQDLAKWVVEASAKSEQLASHYPFVDDPAWRKPQ